MSIDGQKIKKIREELGFSQKEFSYLMGVHSQTVSNWERDILTPSGWFMAILDVLSQNKGSYSQLLMSKGPIRTLSILLDRGLKIEFPSKDNPK